MLYDSKKVSKYALAQIPINSNSTKYTFPDQPQLRGKKIQKIVCYYDVLCPKSPDNIALVKPGALIEGFLVLYVDEREDIKIPLYHLVTQTNITETAYYTNNGYIPLNDLKIVWEKSYVLCPAGYTLTAAQEVFVFGVFYAD